LANGVLLAAGQPSIGSALDRLPLAGLLVTTDGQRPRMEAIRTAIERAAGDSAALPWTTDELKGRSHKQADQIARLSQTALLLILLIAGCSLAVSVAGGLVERKRPFALLRLAGMRSGQLRLVLLAETAAPLVTTAVASAALGLAVAADVMWVSHVPWRPPQPSYWWMLAGGIAVAIGVAAAVTLPLLGRLTAPETARFE
jgi:predicted lysophospholipase L1 biosynthesis ABC-type transport system permease subunit